MPAAAPTTSRRKYWLKRLATFIAVLYFAWCLVLYFVQNTLLFPGPYRAFKPPADAERLMHPIEGGEVFAYLSIPGTSPPHPLAVLFHGNGESINRLDDLRAGYLSRGYAVLTPEYRGYAGCAGSPSETALVEDALAFIGEVAGRPEIDSSHVIYHGRSIGGGVAAQVAARRAPSVLILQSTFISIAGMSWSYGVPPFLVRNPFRTDHVLADLSVPVLLLHGTDDTIVPVAHSRTLATIGVDRTLIELPGGHNNFPIDPGQFWGAIDRWLREHHRSPR